MPVVDNLEVQIKASAKDANEALKTLTNRLDKVTASLGRVNGTGLSQMSFGVNKLANAMANFSQNAKTSDFSRLSRNLKTISEIDMSNISRASSQMSGLSKGIKEVINATNGVSQLQEFTKAIKSLTNSGNAFSGLNQSAKETTSSMNQIVDASGKVLSSAKTITKSSANAIAPLEQQAKKVSLTLEQLQYKYKDLGKGFEFKGSTDAIQKQVDRYSNALEKAKLKQKELEISGNVGGGQYEKAIAKVVEYTNVIESLKKQLQSVSQAENATKSEINGIGFSTKPLAEYERRLITLNESLQKFKMAYGELSNIPKGMLDTPIQNLSASLSELRNAYPKATEIISTYEKELQNLQTISSKLTNEPSRPRVDTSQVQKDSQTIEEKLEALLARFSESGKNFRFTGNFEQLEKETQRLNKELDRLYNRQDRMIELGKVDTEPFKAIARDINNVINKLDVLRDAKPEALNRTLQENAQKAKTLREQLKQLQVPEIKESNLDKLQNELEKSKQKMISLKTELSNKLTIGKITASVDDSGYVSMREQIALTGKTINALQDRIKSVKADSFSNVSEKVSGLGNRVEELKAQLNSLKAQGLNFGDTEFDKIYKELQKATTELNNYKRNLTQSGDESKTTAETTTQNFNRISNVLKILGDDIAGLSGKLKTIGSGITSFFGKIGNVFKTVGSSVSSFATRLKQNIPLINKTSQSTDTLIGKLGRLYIAYHSLRRVGRIFSSIVTSASDYIEEFNYFNVSISKIAKESQGDYKKYGYDSAKEYADSFQERLTDLTSKMSGFEIGKNGELSTNVSMKSLGLNVTDITNFESRIAQMTNSVGMIGEASIAASKGLTMLSGDLSSLTNIPLEQVMNNLSSGLSGAAMAVKKYGIDISVATLSEQAMSLGIEKSVSKMTQAEKEYLRVITMINQSKVAWGDLANTINQPANQFRMLQNSLKSISLIIGNMFMPMIQAVMPYINAMAIAVKDLLQWISNLFGLKWENTAQAVPDVSEYDTGYDDIAESADDAADATDKATDAQKKYNKQLAKFDELNNYTTTKTKDNDKDKDKDKDKNGADVSGILSDALIKAVSDYEAQWNKAFQNMQNNAENLAKKIEALFKRAWDTGDGTEIGEAIATTLNKGIEWVNEHIDQFSAVLNKIASILGTSLNGAISKFNWAGLGEAIGKSIKAALQAQEIFFDTVNWTNLGEKIGESLNAFVDSGVIQQWFETAASKIRAAIETAFGFLTGENKFDFIGLGAAIGEGVNDFLDKMAEVNPETALNAWQELGVAITEGITGLLDVIISTLNTIEWEKVAQAIADLIGSIDTSKIGWKFGELVNAMANALYKLVSDKDTWILIGEKVADGINSAFAATDFELLAETLNALIRNTLTAVATSLQKTDFEEIGKKIGTFLAGLDFTGILSDIATVIWEALKGTFSLLSGMIQEAPLETALITAFAVFKFTGLGKAIAANIATGISSSLAVALQGLTLPSIPILAAIAGVGVALIDLWKTSETFRDTVKSAFDKVKDSLTNAFDKVKDAISPLIDSITGLATSFYDLYAKSFIKPIVDLIASLAASLLGSAIATLIDAFATAVAGLAEVFTGAFDILSGVLDLLTAFFTLDGDKAAEGFGKLGDGIAKGLKGIIDLTAGIGEDIIGGLLKGIADAIKSIATWVKNTVVDPLVKAFKASLGIHSPSTVMAGIGVNIMEGLKKGIESMIKKVTDAFGNIKTSIVKVWDSIKTKTQQVWQNISNTASKVWDNLKSWANEKFTNIKNSITGVWDNVKSKTTEVWNNISSSVQSTWNNVKSWASEKFNAVKESVKTAWDNVQEKTSSTWNTVSSTLSTKWNDFKSWASDKFGAVKQSVTKAWDEVKSKTTSTWKDVSDTLSTKWGNFKTWASDKFSKVEDSVKTAWNNIKTKTSSIWSDSGNDSVTKLLSGAWDNLKTWASDKFDKVKNSVTTAWNNIKTNTDDIWSGRKSVPDVLSDAWDNIKKNIKNALTGDDGIVSKLSNAWDSIKRTAESAWKKIGEVILSPIKTAINGIKSGINWVLDKLGAKDSKITGNPPYSKFAKGSSGLSKDTVGVVNDQAGSTYREMIVPPHGKPFIPKGRNITLPMKKGTKIMPAKQTKEFINSMSSMPHFAKGIGDLFGGAWAKIKEFTGNIWDYLSKPKELLQLAVNKFTDLSDAAEIPLAIAKGSVNTIVDNAVEFIKKAFTLSGSPGVESAINWAIAIANDDSHGYDQNRRWGPDYDCSSLVIAAFEQAGIKLKSVGANATGSMYNEAKSVGFQDVTSAVNLGTGKGLQRGDILLAPGAHTELYIGNGQTVGAHINEKGGTRGGQTGDQTGHEIDVGPYRNHPYKYVLRYFGNAASGGAAGGYTSQGEPNTPVSYIPSAGVKQWTDIATKALQLTGQYSPQNLMYLLEQMKHESDGNPNDVNNWDINAKNGTPSKGLMQVIDPTFKEYAMKGYDKNIFDPLSNIIAAIRYTVSRYGSLYSGWAARGYKGYATGIGTIYLSDIIKGYADGGFPTKGQLFLAREAGAEMVGSVGGKTAVVNNDQIVESVAKGIKDAILSIINPNEIIGWITAGVSDALRLFSGNGGSIFAENSATTGTNSSIVVGHKDKVGNSDLNVVLEQTVNIKSVSDKILDFASFAKEINNVFTSTKTGLQQIIEDSTLAIKSLNDVTTAVEAFLHEKFEGAVEWIKTEVIDPIGTSVNESWGNIQTELSDIPTWISDNVTTPILDKFKEIFELVTTEAPNAWSNMSSAASTEFEKISSLADTVKEKIEAIISTANTAIETLGNLSELQSKVDIQEDYKYDAVNIGESSKETVEVPIKISDAVQEVTKKLNNSVISTAVAAVGFNTNTSKQDSKKKESDITQETANTFESIAEPIEKTLDRIKGLTQSFDIFQKTKVRRFARGGLSKDEVGVVNDQAGSAYKELIIPPNGVPFIPDGRNVMLPMQRGTRIIPAEKTKKFLKNLPHFANGTEDFADDKKSKGSNSIVDGITKAINDTVIPYIREIIRILEGNTNSGTTLKTSNKKTTTKYSDTVKEIQAAWNDLAKWFETTVVQPIETTFATMKEQIVGIFNTINEDIATNYEEYSKEWQETLMEIPTWISEGVSSSVLEQFTTLFSSIQEELATALSNAQDTLSETPDWIETNVTSAISSKFADMFIEVSKGFSDMWSSVSLSAEQALKKMDAVAVGIIDTVQKIIDKTESAINAINRATQAQNEAAIQAQVKQVTNDISNAVQDVTSQLGNSVISAAVGGFGNNNNNISISKEEQKTDTAKVQTTKNESENKKASNSIVSTVSYTTEALGSIARETSNTFEAVNEKMKKTLNRLGNIDFSNLRVKQYATGGFPEDGWFRASHGEMIGQFDNGQSVVANNQQITSGIADAVYPAVYNAMMAAIANAGGSGDVVVQIDGDTVFKAVRNKDNDFYKRNHRGAFQH